MAKSTRVFNLTTKRYIKRSQAAGRIEQCISEWVEHSSRIRDLSLREVVERRSEQARTRELIPFAELPRIVYRPMERNKAGNRGEMHLMREANRFAHETTEKRSAKESHV